MHTHTEREGGREGGNEGAALESLLWKGHQRSKLSGTRSPHLSAKLRCIRISTRAQHEESLAAVRRQQDGLPEYPAKEEAHMPESSVKSLSARATRPPVCMGEAFAEENEGLCQPEHSE